MTTQHDVLHQFAAGLNTDSGVNWPAIPFQTPGSQGWKIVYEPFQRGYALADGVKWESIVETSGTVTYGVNGVIITTNGSDDSSGFLGWATANLMIGAVTKKFYFETSFTLTAATMASNEMYIGFSDVVDGDAITDLVNTGGTAWVSADGFGFGKLDGATELDFITMDGGTEQTIGLGITPTTAVRMKLGCYYDGQKFNIYKDDVLLSSTAKTSLNVDTGMSLCAYCKDGSGAAQTLVANYVLLATEL